MMPNPATAIETLAPSLTVIIATKNRAEELRTISLPSLARQDTRDFEVIVWDASEDDAAQSVVDAFTLGHPDCPIRYCKAPRAGTAAQRNDALTEALGEIVFFMDDDSEISPDGISVLNEMFRCEEGLAGASLPLENVLPLRQGLNGKVGRLTRALMAAYAGVFYTSPRLSGVFPSTPPSEPGPIDRLWGSHMALRKKIFRDHRFDERLQRFGGYAFGEDQLLSHRLHREGLLLSVAERGLVTHRTAPGERRGNHYNKGLSEGYNAAIVWRESILPFAPWSVIPFLWARFGFAFIVLLQCLRWPWQKMRWERMAGYFAGLGVFALEEIRQRRGRFTRGKPPALPLDGSMPEGSPTASAPHDPAHEQVNVPADTTQEVIG